MRKYPQVGTIWTFTCEWHLGELALVEAPMVDDNSIRVLIFEGKSVFGALATVTVGVDPKEFHKLFSYVGQL